MLSRSGLLSAQSNIKSAEIFILSKDSRSLRVFVHVIQSDSLISHELMVGLVIIKGPARNAPEDVTAISYYIQNLTVKSLQAKPFYAITLQISGHFPQCAG